MGIIARPKAGPETGDLLPLLERLILGVELLEGTTGLSTLSTAFRYAASNFPSRLFRLGPLLLRKFHSENFLSVSSSVPLPKRRNKRLSVRESR